MAETDSGPSFGEYLRAYRLAAVDPATGRRVSQGVLASKLVDAGFVYETSMISRWENGRRNPPQREVIEAIGDVLSLTPEQRENLLAAAGYVPIEREEIGRRVQGVEGETTVLHSRLDQLANHFQQQIDDLSQQVQVLSRVAYRSLNPVAEPIIPVGPLSLIGSGVQRVSFPALFMGGVGYGLKALGLQDTWNLLAYVGLAMVMMLALGMLRFARSSADAGDYREADDVDRLGYGIGELLFISLFIMLNTPLLQASMTRMDIYGFYAIPALTGTLLPLLYAAVVNLLLSLTAAALFHVLWLNLYEGRSGQVYTRTVKVLLPPLLVAYIPAAVFSTIGGEVYYLIVFALLFGAFTVITAFRDPEVRLGEWEAKLCFIVAIGAMFVLFVLAIAGMLVNYLGYAAVPDHSKFWAWTVDWAALGYPESEFAIKHTAGFLWMVLTGIAYMLIVVGGYLLVTIYRWQVTRCS